MKGQSLNHEFSFPEDDAASFLILLRIAHLQFSKLPSVLTTEDLFKLAVLCDKHDAVSAVRPWLSTWIKKAEWKGATTSQRPLWLFIAWVFGEDVLFQHFHKILALDFSAANPQQLSVIGGNLGEDYPHVTGL